MKILLLGANGQVGYELRSSLARLGAVIAASRDGRLEGGENGVSADIGDTSALLAALHEHRPDIVVNAAAYTAVDKAETDRDAAFAVNATGPAALARWAADAGALVVHYSTDYVFDGEGKRPYREADATAPLGVYGESKLAGEHALAESGAPYMNFRTAWVYAPRGKNFLLTMIRLGGERDHLKVVSDQIGAPTPASLLASATATAIEVWMGAGERRSQLSGSYHLVASGQTSWHGFAEAIFAGAKTRGILSSVPVVEPIASSQFPTPAKRPGYSVLDNSHFQQTFGVTLPTWQTELNGVLNALKTNPSS